MLGTVPTIFKKTLICHPGKFFEAERKKFIRDLRLLVHFLLDPGYFFFITLRKNSGMTIKKRSFAKFIYQKSKIKHPTSNFKNQTSKIPQTRIKFLL